jgi:FlaA1/EpsC-like NDP-sugar epimerase
MQSSLDAGSWVPALAVAALLRYDLSPSRVPWAAVAVFTALAMALQVGVGRAFGLYIHRWRYGTFDEVAAAVRAALVVGGVLTLVDLLPWLGRPVPLSTTVAGTFLALFVMGCGRFAWRVQYDRWQRAGILGRTPVIVVGAGEAGSQIVTSMLTSGPYHPVALLDDNPDLRNLQIKGVPVRGDRTALGRVAEETGAEVMVIAIPSADAALVRELVHLADGHGLTTLIVPPVADLLGSAVGVGDIRPLTEADLLGRRELSLDIEAVAHYLTGRRVLVTGAGGSIGSELCRQIHRFAPESLVMLDRDETALQAVQLSIEGRGLLEDRNLVVACIRDRARLAEVFAEHRPQVVFHAAALKHLPLLELHPDEGFKTNVVGTANVAELAVEFGVDHFVNISTDKAAEPTSVLGRTKRLAEQLVADAARRSDGIFISVRFGNVLGSRGSVLPLFREQIARGGPVTVTHPEVRRYFMTIPEACELVIQAGAIGTDGEVMVLDMGEQVRIVELAERLIAESGRPVEIVYTGLRPGEKLAEQLFGDGEEPRPSAHPLISRVAVEPVPLAGLRTGGAAVIDLRAGDGSAAPTLFDPTTLAN